MLIHPYISAETVLSNVDDEMVQMHALDIRIEQLYELRGVFLLDGDTRQHRDQVSVGPNENGFFELQPGTMYALDTKHQVTMAKGEAGFIISRSTLTRNGIVAGSALYDAGYSGGVNGYIANHTHYPAYIKYGERVGQFLIMAAETAKMYKGVYNKEIV